MTAWTHRTRRPSATALRDSDFALRLYHKFNDWFDRYLPKHRYIVEEIESLTAVYLGIMKTNGIPVNLPAHAGAQGRG